jgi:sensor domain CHASE-containing protein
MSGIKMILKEFMEAEERGRKFDGILVAAIEGDSLTTAAAGMSPVKMTMLGKMLVQEQKEHISGCEACQRELASTSLHNTDRVVTSTPAVDGKGLLPW